MDQVLQQKCLAHLIRNVTDVVQSKQGRARQFGMGLNVLLREGLALWHARRDLAPEDFQIRYRELDEKLTHQLRNRILQDDDNQRLLNGIGTQHDRGNLLRFLETEGVEPTNNHAERILRLGVLWRKNAFGCHSAAGCRYVERMLTVVQTLRLQGRPVLDYLYQAIVAHRAGLPAPQLLGQAGD